MNEPYQFVDDCPMCGQKDEENLYKGARVGSSDWGHSYLCCSEKCGRAFLNSPQHKKLERLRIRSKIASLKAELKG